MRRDTEASMSDIVTQLKITNRLLVAQMKVGGAVKQVDLIKLLATTGASMKEIADALDTTPGTVQTSLQRLKKKPGKAEGSDAKE